MSARRKKIVFVTGTRAEFGLLTPVLHAARASAAIELHEIATVIAELVTDQRCRDRAAGEGLEAGLTGKRQAVRVVDGDEVWRDRAWAEVEDDVSAGEIF